jgi:two-component system, OmpR family, sensor kinase
VTLRARVALSAAAAILIAVAVVAITVSVLVAHQLHSSLDRSLRERASDVARLSVSAPALLTAPGALESRIGGHQVSVEVVDRRDRLVARSLSLGGSLLPTDLARPVIATGRAVYGSTRLNDERLRLYAAPLPAIGGAAAGGAVIVAASTGDIAETLHRLHLFALLSALGATLLAAGAAFVLVRRALRPLERLSAGAGEIERTADVGRRLPQPATRDEVGRLAATLNRMLAALESARERERRFLADASHELRSPVTTLRGNAEFLRRHGYDEAALADLAADAERLSALIDDLLALSREDAGEPPEQRVELGALARAVAGDDPQLVVDAGTPVLVAGDRAALERALANLVENARLHGPADGQIMISAGTVNGTARAFDRFWRGRRDGPGSGLGLAIVRATAERHGGRATAEAAEFTIELPLLRELSNDAGRPDPEPRKGRAR